MALADSSEDDYQTEVRTIRRLKRLQRKADWKEQYYSKNGKVVRYVPMDNGYLVISQDKEVLGKLYG